MTVIDFFKIMGACAAVIAAFIGYLNYRNSKTCLLRRITRKESQIRYLDQMMVERYGARYVIQKGFFPKTDIERKQEDLKDEIAELRRRM